MLLSPTPEPAVFPAGSGYGCTVDGYTIPCRSPSKVITTPSQTRLPGEPYQLLPCCSVAAVRASKVALPRSVNHGVIASSGGVPRGRFDRISPFSKLMVKDVCAEPCARNFGSHLAATYTRSSLRNVGSWR